MTWYTRDMASPISSSPLCNCLILCDDVVVSQKRGKHTLDGIVTGIRVLELPTTIAPMMCYIRLTGVHPGQRLTIIMEHADGAGEPAFSGVMSAWAFHHFEAHTPVAAGKTGTVRVRDQGSRWCSRGSNADHGYTYCVHSGGLTVDPDTQAATRAETVSPTMADASIQWNRPKPEPKQSPDRKDRPDRPRDSA